MTKEEVIRAIEEMQKFQTETVNLEAKTASVDFPKKCYDTISSFSNKNGGIIIFGLNEEKGFDVENVYDINDLQKQISTLCSDSFEPVVRPEFLPLEYENKKILAVKIKELQQNDKPCYYKPKGLAKGSYIRVCDRDEVMTDYELYTIQSYKEGIKEELKAVRRAKLEDLDQEKLTKYLSEIKQNKPNLAKFSDEKILELSGIITRCNDCLYPTLAGIMIFGLYPQGYFPQIFVACCLVPGKKLGDIGEVGQRFDDNKRIDGTIEEMLQGTLSFLRKNMKNKVVINPKTGIREDISEYPMNALREAVANALIHRDYSITGSYIQVYMYDDRIEILSPGSLYGTNKIYDLGETKMMEIRNETILRILEENDSFVENRHTGIPTMKAEMKKAGLPEPLFEEDRNSFKVTFKNNFDSQYIKEDKNLNNDTAFSKSKIGVFEKITNFFFKDIA